MNEQGKDILCLSDRRWRNSWCRNCFILFAENVTENSTTHKLNSHSVTTATLNKISHLVQINGLPEFTQKVTLTISGDTIKHVFALIEQKHQENNISKDLIEEAILKLPIQIRVVYKKRNKVISCIAKS